MVSLVSLLALLGAPFLAQDRSEVATLVERLGAPEPTTRLAAERALGLALLEPRRGAELSTRRGLEASVEQAPAEARRRVARVLGADDRMFPIAAWLHASSTGAPQAVGREALDAQLARWSVSAFDEPDVAVFDPGRQRSDLPRLWTERVSLELELDPLEGGALLAFDRLDRLGGGPVPIIVDPRVASSAVRRPQAPLRAGPARVDGTWGDLLEALCGIHGVAYQLQGFRFGADPGDDDDLPPPRAWIHIVPRGTTELAPAGRDLRMSAAEHILGWCDDLVREGDIVRQIAAARALAGLDWPAATAWLEARWLATGDVPALEGLLAAAARGRVALTLQRPDVVRSALALVDGEARDVMVLAAARRVAVASKTIEETDAALQAAAVPADRRARRFALGLAGLAPVAPGGEASMLDILFERFDAAPPTGRWVRLVAAEGMGVEHREAARHASRVLRGEIDARSRRQALRTLLRTRAANAPPVDVADPTAIFAEVGSDVRGLGLELGLAGVRTNATRFVDHVRGDPAALAEILVFGTLARYDEAPPWLVAALPRLLDRPPVRTRAATADPLAIAIHRSHGDVRSALGRIAELVASELGPGVRSELERRLLRAGAARPSEESAALSRATNILERAGAEASGREVEDAWLDLAGLAGSRDEERARSALEDLGAALGAELEGRRVPSGATSSALVDAVESAIRALRRARRDAAAESFLQRLRGAATRGDHPMAQRLFRDDWPPPPELAPRDLMLVEPPLPPR